MRNAYKNVAFPDLKERQKWAVLSPLFVLFSKFRPPSASSKHVDASRVDPDMRDDVRKFQERLQPRLAEIEVMQNETRAIRSLVFDPEKNDRLKKSYLELVESLVGLCSCDAEADSFLDFLANAAVKNRFPDYFLDAVIEVQDNLRQAHPGVNQIRADEWLKIYHLESIL